VIDIPYIEIEALGPTQRVSSRHLCEASDAWTNAVAAPVIIRIQRQISHEQRPRADDTHVAAQHIEQLGQLVDRCRSQPSAERRETAVVGQQIPLGVALVDHAAKFQQPEWPIVETGANLSKKHGMSEARANQHGDDEQQRNPDWAREDDKRQIEQALSGVRLHQ
jgi:hypothetical protein